MRYLHTMLRVADPQVTIGFFKLLGLRETRRIENEQGRFTLIFLAAGEDHHSEGQPGAAEVELTYNWPPEDGSPAETCARLQAGGVTINRPPRDGYMAFVRSPDGISIELLQQGERKAPAEPWASMPT